eukprot:1185499-Pyramimonas_sp.AAC.1
MALAGVAGLAVAYIFAGLNDPDWLVVIPAYAACCYAFAPSVRRKLGPYLNQMYNRVTNNSYQRRYRKDRGRRRPSGNKPPINNQHMYEDRPTGDVRSGTAKGRDNLDNREGPLGEDPRVENRPSAPETTTLIKWCASPCCYLLLAVAPRWLILTTRTCRLTDEGPIRWCWWYPVLVLR